MSEKTLYECTNHPACSLGTVGQPGYFTGGITAAQLHVITGKPVEAIDDKEHGDGVCPNCGQRGKEVKS